RAIWRDLPALLPSSLQSGQQAAVLGWAANLNLQLGYWDVYQPILMAGIASKIQEPKFYRWRSEYIALPASMLTNPDISAQLREQIKRAESLHEKLRTLATN